MNRRQKIAWFQLSLVAAAAVLSVILMFHFMTKYEYGYLYACELGAAHSVPLLLLTIFGPLVFRKKKGRVDFDERDLIIDRQSAVASFGAFFAFFVVVFVAMWLTMGMDTLIPIHWLGGILIGGWTTAIVANAVMVLICYGRKGKDGQ